MQFSKSIPDKVFENATSAHFIAVLDSLQEYKQGMIADSIRSYNPILCNNKKWLKKYLADLGFGGVPDDLPINVLQQMLLNADTIMRLRGSYQGLEFFVSVVSLGEVTIDASNFLGSLKRIYPDSLAYGYITGSKSDIDHKYMILYSGSYGNRTQWVYAIGDYSGNFLYGVKLDGTTMKGTGVTDAQVAEMMRWYYSSEIRFLVDNNVDLSSNNLLGVSVKSKFFNGNYPTEQAAILEYLNKVIPTYVGFADNLILTINTEARTGFYYHELLNGFFVNDPVETAICGQAICGLAVCGVS